jgi:DNA-directed RNA polymerase subunit RPC12/RpoP
VEKCKERFGMSKVKMRCARCSKPFKSSDAKQTLCPDCLAKERLAKARAAAAPQSPAQAKPVQPPKIIGPAASILGARPTITQEAPPDRGLFGSAARNAEQDERRNREHGPQGSPPGAPHGQRPPQAPGQREAQTLGATQEARPERNGAKDRAGAARPRSAGHEHGAPRQERPARQPRAPRAPQPPQELTPEQQAQVEQRYLELAQPAEFDGIRTQIATELGLPKVLVRKAVLDLRKRMQLPSWWETQAFTGSPSDLERVRAAYMPHLPVPPVGVHKQIAEELGMEPHAVYRAIRQVRASMRLPQYNAPELHPEMPRREEQEEKVATPVLPASE